MTILATARPHTQTPLQVFAMEIIKFYPATEKAIHEALLVENHYGLRQQLDGAFVFSWRDFFVTLENGVWSTTFNGYTGTGKTLAEADTDFQAAYREYYKAISQ